MGLEVIRPGPSTTVQDRGRTGHRAFGVPVGGAFDVGSLDLANALLGNPPESAALELTGGLGEFRARVDLALALAGAAVEAEVATSAGIRRTVEMPGSFTLRAGERLILGGMPRGLRSYLAVRGGWQTPVVLGSRSSETRLRVGELIPARMGSTPVRRPAAGWISPPTDEPLRVVAGPDAEALADLERATYHVSPRSDRMGLRLDGPSLPLTPRPERMSMPVAPGAVQVAGGLPIVLGVACGTMGGYPHVAHVISADLDRVGQLRPGDTVRFRLVGLAEARELDRLRRADRRRRLAPIRMIGGVDTFD